MRDVRVRKLSSINSEYLALVSTNNVMYILNKELQLVAHFGGVLNVENLLVTLTNKRECWLDHHKSFFSLTTANEGSHPHIRLIDGELWVKARGGWRLTGSNMKDMTCQKEW